MNWVGPAGVAGGARAAGCWSAVRGALPCGVPDGCDHELQVAVIEAGDVICPELSGQLIYG